MIVPADLLAGLQRLLKRIEPDIRTRCKPGSEIDARLRAEYEKARSASRTAQAYEVWRDDYITQVAVAWILSCVFVRFLEDNRLMDTVWLAGPHERLQLARDQHTLYFQANPTHSDREYLEHVFDEIAKFPSMRDLLGGSHNPISKLGPTGDGAHELLEFWQKVDPATGVIIYDFTDPEWSTRFLGDLYQDLSESARERYALLQTPEFVEEFILDRTLTPAVEEFGYSTVKMIDPACGSGHFLLGAFRRLLDFRLRHEPGVPVRAQVQAVLGQVFGLDVNPFAAAIARFRLLIASMKACGFRDLPGAPDFEINVAIGDSLLHGPSPRGLVGVQKSLEDDPLQHFYDTEDADKIREFLDRTYHVVVGNPPYLTVKDRALNRAYRTRFSTCHMKFSLALPFKERFFDLAIQGSESERTQSGFIGLITASSFMRREFGRRLIEDFLVKWDLTHIVDTSRAHIPGHGTPTVILVARAQRPLASTIRTVMGITAEHDLPTDPAKGKVWTSILDLIDHPGSQNEFVSVLDIARQSLAKHPWSIGGAGAIEVKAIMDDAAEFTLQELSAAMGITAVTGNDEVYTSARAMDWKRRRVEHFVPFVTGDVVRDWAIGRPGTALWLYDSQYNLLSESMVPNTLRFLWPFRSILSTRRRFGTPMLERGLTWYEWQELYSDKLVDSKVIVFPNVATHNHFVFNCEEAAVFNSTAMVVKLKDQYECDRYDLVALLNTSAACFWIKQVCHNKGARGIGGGLTTEAWEQFYQVNVGALKDFPIPLDRATAIVLQIQEAIDQLQANTAETAIMVHAFELSQMEEIRTRYCTALSKLVFLQEELDWKFYSIFGITTEDLSNEQNRCPLVPGERAFEIVMAQNLAVGNGSSEWFTRHGIGQTREVRGDWPPHYQELVKKRIAAIRENPLVQVLEKPEHKRRWSLDPWHERSRRLLRNWLLARIEEFLSSAKLELTSSSRIGDHLQTDLEFQQVARLYLAKPDVDFGTLVFELVESEAVPLLPGMRYTESGARKREIWERTWELQRHEDAIDAEIHAEIQADQEIPDLLKREVAKKRKADEIGDILPPPKYDSKDFQRQSFWSLRGKLDVPKERFISFPRCERDADRTPVIAWAGWDKLQQAQAIAAYYERVKNHEGWMPERRIPLLGGILELLSWLKQWHNEIHPEYHERMGDFFQHFVEDEARAMEMTLDDIRGWTPPAQSSTRRRRKRNT